jgi:hypothetical protein
LKELISRIYHSPTINTWGSFAARTLSLLIVLPLLLTRLTTAEIALWYLFSSVISLQALADLGFSPTFTRVIAYAMGGAEDLKDFREVRESTNSGRPNWATMEKIWSTIRSIYLRSTIVSMVFLAIVGTIALVRPIAAIENQSEGWLSWIVIAVTSGVAFWGTMYSASLQGMNHIALFRRWEMLTSFAAILTSFVVLYAGGKLFELVLANQSWLVVAVFRNRWLARNVEDSRLKGFKGFKIHHDILQAVWPSAWRSGLGITMSYGVVQASGIVYAQFGSAAGIASYLLALRIMQTINLFSQAPFYSKIPVLARLRSEGRLHDQVAVAQRGMAYAYWTFVVGFVCAGLFLDPLLELIKSHARFADPVLWSLMGIAFFVERFGAMHIQLYSTTNHIIWHTANGITGIINIVVVVLTFKYIGVYSFPIGMAVGTLGFYCWYAAKHSYRAFKLSFWSFERKTFLVPLGVVLTYSIVVPIFLR